MKRAKYAVAGGAGRPAVFLSDGMEVDIMISARVRVLEIDDDNRMVLLRFLDAATGRGRDGEVMTEIEDDCDAWMRIDEVVASKPIASRVEMYNSYLVRLRELVTAAQPDEAKRNANDRHILQIIDDAIGAPWLRARQETDRGA